ncbi:MAG: DUF427 domain-containing protein [Gemmatimonadales bacterium]|jgi:uncharacterized protein (DUF427 family)
MAIARWNGIVLAESDTYEFLEGNVYFPPQSLNREYFRESDHSTTCPWKGEASYFDIVVDGQTNRDAAWYYPEPSDEASHIKGHVAFWKGITVER